MQVPNTLGSRVSNQRTEVSEILRGNVQQAERKASLSENRKDEVSRTSLLRPSETMTPWTKTVQASTRMGRATPRHRTQIWYEILNSIISEEKTSVAARITHVQNQVGLPSDRLRAHLQEMRERGLILFLGSLNSTVMGREFVNEYERARVVLARFKIE